MTKISVFQSALVHFALLGFLFWSPWMKKTPPIMWFDGDINIYGGGGGKGTPGKKGSGLKKEQMGQVVPQPIKKVSLPKAAPKQRAEVGDEKWKVKDEKEVKVAKKVTPLLLIPWPRKVVRQNRPQIMLSVLVKPKAMNQGREVMILEPVAAVMEKALDLDLDLARDPVASVLGGILGSFDNESGLNGLNQPSMAKNLNVWWD